MKLILGLGLASVAALALWLARREQPPAVNLYPDEGPDGLAPDPGLPCPRCGYRNAKPGPCYVCEAVADWPTFDDMRVWPDPPDGWWDRAQARQSRIIVTDNTRDAA